MTQMQRDGKEKKEGDKKNKHYADFIDTAVSTRDGFQKISRLKIQ